MKKMKRLIALVTVAMFVFSFAAPAVAAADASTAPSSAVIGKDVKGTKYEKDAQKLIGLGIVKGFEDGTVRPAEKVTRAQFAAIVAQELGIGADAGQSATKFKDVPATHWASGLVNIAVGKGIIKGYTDGTFRPDQPVTNAEAYAMLVQMLGWGPALKDASWPAGVLARAASLGVSTGIKGASNAAMLRGEVIIAAANSLDADMMAQDAWGTDTTYSKDEGKTILSEVFDIEVFDGAIGDDNEMKKVTAVPMSDLSGLKADEIQFDGQSKKYTVASNIDPNAFLGQTVEVWVDTDDVVYYIGGSDDETVVYDTVKDVVDANTVTLDKADDDYDFAANADVWVNLNNKEEIGNGGFDATDLNVDSNVKVVLDADDNILAAVVTDYSASDAGVGLVSEVDVTNETIDYDGGSLTSTDLDGKDYVVVKDGVNATLSDVKVGDIVNVLENTSDDTAYVAVTSTQVKGTADVSSDTDSANVEDYTVTVNGADYDVDDDATYSDDNNDTVSDLSSTDLQDINGEEITVYLDAKGEVAHIVSGSVESTKLVGVISEEAYVNSDNPARVSVEFKLTNSKGTELSFDFDPADVKINDVKDDDGSDWSVLTADANDPVVVEYKLDSNGDLSSLDVVTDEYKTIQFDANEDDKTITATGDLDGDFQITDKTIIIDALDPTDAKAATWDNIKTKENLDAYAKVDDDKVTDLVIFDGATSLTSDTKYAVVTGVTTVGVDKDKAVNLLLPDKSTAKIICDGATVGAAVYGQATVTSGVALAKGQFISYDLDSDGELDTVTVLAQADQTLIKTNLAVNSDFISAVPVDENWYQGVATTVKSSSINLMDNAGVVTTKSINPDTKIFNVSDKGDLTVGGSITKGDYVIYIDGDDDNRTADYVIVVTEDVAY